MCFFYFTLLKPHATTQKNDSPIRKCGNRSTEVVDKKMILTPKLRMPAVPKPEQEFNVRQVSSQKVNDIFNRC
jgi:hypothetical protein